jgi:hypothetical protein
MPISERKLAALRQNAQKSTGPRTPLGKFRSSRNALKHGNYAKFNLVTALIKIPARDRRRFLTMLIKKHRRLVTGYSSKIPTVGRVPNEFVGRVPNERVPRANEKPDTIANSTPEGRNPCGFDI